jgi:hypothetical protein
MADSQLAADGPGWQFLLDIAFPSGRWRAG